MSTGVRTETKSLAIVGRQARGLAPSSLSVTAELFVSTTKTVGTDKLECAKV